VYQSRSVSITWVAKRLTSQGRLHFWSCVYVWSGISIHLLWEYIASEYQLTRSFDHNIETGTRGTDAFLRPRKRSASFIYPLRISPSIVYDIIYLSFSLLFTKILPSGRIAGSMIRYDVLFLIRGALCRRSWVKRTSRDIPRPTAQRKPSFYLCLSLFLSLSISFSLRGFAQCSPVEALVREDAVPRA